MEANLLIIRTVRSIERQKIYLKSTSLPLSEFKSYIVFSPDSILDPSTIFLIPITGAIRIEITNPIIAAAIPYSGTQTIAVKINAAVESL